MYWLTFTGEDAQSQITIIHSTLSCLELSVLLEQSVFCNLVLYTIVCIYIHTGYLCVDMLPRQCLFLPLAKCSYWAWPAMVGSHMDVARDCALRWL